jgi:uncharacterized protein
MEIHVDTWDPTYGTSFEAAGPQRESTAQVAADVERPVAAWRPIDPPTDARPPDTVLLVDGVQRIDTRIWITDEGTTHLGLAASYAAGVVGCDLRERSATLVGSAVERGLFSSYPAAPTLRMGAVRYPAFPIARGEPKDLQLGLQRNLHALEVALSSAARTDGDLLIADGPLQGRTHLPRALGYVKSQHSTYLPAELTPVVTALRAGQRSPVFMLGTSWNRYSWYLRLPGPAGQPWSGIVRVECAADLGPAAAVDLAHLSAVTLPRFASSAYKDPRAPQNLVPIAGLERRLRSMLGDQRLLLRSLTAAARRIPAQQPVIR